MDNMDSFFDTQQLDIFCRYRNSKKIETFVARIHSVFSWEKKY